MYTVDNRTSRRRLGDIGESVACKFLEKRGFCIVERNYLKKWGELDIIATKTGTYHFVEVKSIANVPCATIRPEENVHPQKIKRMYRAIETYLLEREVDAGFQIDVVTVLIDAKTRHARVELIENIVGF